MTAWLGLQHARCKSSTVGAYHTSMVHFHDFLKKSYRARTICEKHIAHLSKSRLQKYIIYLNDKKITPYTKVNYLLAAKKYLLWEVEQGTIKEDLLTVLDRKNLPKVPEYLPRPLSSDTDRYLQNLWRKSNDPHAMLFLFLRLTGLRISELIQLPGSCVVTTAKNERFLKVPLGKMDNERLVPLSEETIALIDQIKNAYPIEKHKIDPERLIGISGCVSTVYKHLRNKFAKSIGTITDQNKPVTFHRLRHTYATTLLSGGVGIASIMKLLGHRRIEMSLRYAKVTPTHLRKEYLKAIEVLEAQSGLPRFEDANTKESYLPRHPSELLNQLSAFVHKAALIESRQKRVLIQRISRLKQHMLHIEFSQNFNSQPSN